MANEIEDESTIRRYLLGQLGEDERQQLEERIMTDTEYFERTVLVEDELVEEYVRGELSAEERENLEGSFLATPEGQRRVSFARALSKYVAKSSAPEAQGKVIEVNRSVWRRAAEAPYFRLSAAAVVLLVAGLGIWRLFFFQSDVTKGMSALAAAYREQRPVEARISGFGYAPVASTRGDDEKVDQLARDRAERILLDAVFENPGPASRHALGRLYLAERQFDKAIAQFEEALKADANNARLHSDYGAALMEKGKFDQSGAEPGKSLEEFARALEHLSKALELDGDLLEALFNRALCRQYLMLPRQAEEDWRAYLEKDASSKWADEARQHLLLLEERRTKASKTQEDLFGDFRSAYQARDSERAWQIICQSRDALSGSLFSERLLDAYLVASQRGDTESANNEFRALTYLGALEAQRAKDTYVSGLAMFYRSSSVGHRAKLAEARRLMKSGYEFSARSKPLDAIGVCNKAKEVFAQLGDEWEALQAQQWIGYCYLEAADTERGITILDQLVQPLDARNHEWLLMRTYFLLSRGEYDRNEYSKAIDYDKRALALADRIGDKIGIFNALSMLTEQYRYLGNFRESLRCAQRSTALIDSCPLNPIQLERHYGIVAMAFGSFGHFTAAIDYQSETLRGALIGDRFQHASAAYAHIGLMHGKLGNYQEALKSARLAYETAASLPDEPMKKKMMAYSSLQMGHLYREAGDISEAIQSYDRCIKLYADLDFHYYVYEAHKNRLFTYLMAGNDPLVAEELNTTLRLAEKYRSKILEGENRNNFFDLEQSVYDLAIDFEYSRMNNPRKAFEYSEGSRSRSLLDLVSTRTRLSDSSGQMEIIFETVARPLMLAEIQKRMPEQAQILQYAVLRDKILVWVVSKSEFSVVEKVIAQEELSEKVLSYVRVVSNIGEGDEVKKRSEDLFDVLIGPAQQFLQNDRSLYVIPDKVLNHLPFAALLSRDSGRFLLQDYLIAVAPSSGLLVACSEVARAKEDRTGERLLSVGNPRFDRSAFPSLPDLPSAGREAREIAAYYSPMTTSLLTGDNARENRVKSEMTKSDVIHFALHAVVDEQTPMRSKLLLTEEPERAVKSQGANGELEALEVYGLKLNRTRLVVLSACQTGVGRYYQGEGIMNIARPFIVAGVPLVIASLWPVDSDSTEELMTRFHKYRRVEGFPTTEALRRAQLDMLGSPEERFHQPFNWAAFVAFGGMTTF